MTGKQGSRQMSLTEVSTCPSCSSQQSQLVRSIADSLTHDMYGDQLSEKVINRLVRCESCQLVRLDPRLSDNSLRAVYADWYRDGYGESQAGHNHDRARAIEFETGHLARLSEVVRPPGALLDVGTGSGLFLQVADRAGWDASGVDFSAAAAALAKQHHGLTVHVGTLSDLPDAERYDVITMFDYLEHTTTPAQDVDAAYSRLKAGGYLVVRVPNFGGWQAKLMREAWVGIISLHLSYFEVDTLSRLLKSHGFSVVREDCGNYQSLWQLLGKKMSWLRHKAAVLHVDSSVATAVKNPTSNYLRALRFALASFYEIVDHIGGWFGASNYIFVVARKQ